MVAGYRNDFNRKYLNIKILRLILLLFLPLSLACYLLGFGAAADVHFLNSLEGGEACLLVDSYGDLTNGVALEEAFLLIEVNSLDIERGNWRKNYFPGGWMGACSFRSSRNQASLE